MYSKNNGTFLKILFVFLLGVASISNKGATITSTSSGGNWSLTSTWSGGVVPGVSDDVVIVGNVLLTSNVSCASLSVTGYQKYLDLANYDFSVSGSVILSTNNEANIKGTGTSKSFSIGGDLSINSYAGYVNTTGYNINVGGNVTLATQNSYMSIGSNNLSITGSYTNTSGYNSRITWSTGNVSIAGAITVSKQSSNEPLSCTSTGYLILNGTSQVFTANTNISVPLLRQSVNSFTKAGSGTLTVTTSFDRYCSSVPTISAGVFNVSGTTLNATPCSPIIIVSGTLSALNTCAGIASSNTSFSITGLALTSGILITPPTGFEVSTSSNSGFSTSLTVGSTGTLTSTLIYVRLASSASVGTYSGNIVLTSSGATTVNVATISSSIIAAPTVASNLSSQSVCGTSSLTLSGNNPTVGTGSWTVSGQSSSSSQFANLNVYNTTFTPNGGVGNYTVLWTISNGTCSSLATATISVNAIPTPGSISGSATICSGYSSGTLTLIGNSNSVTKWQSSTISDFSSPLDIANTTSTYTSGALSTTTYYRAVISTGTCIANSAIATITVIPSVTTATNGSTQTICANVSATLSGNNPTVGTGAWSVSGPSSSSTQFANSSLYNTTFTQIGGAGSYIVTWTTSNAACSTSATATITVTAIPTPGTLSGSTTVCSGNSSGTLTLSGNSNSVTKWQSSTVSDFSSNVTDISNTSTTYSSGVLSSSIYYRAVTSNGTCIANSAIATITVNQSPTSATNGSTQTICANVPATLSGNSPTIGTGAWSVSGQSLSLSQFANVNAYNTTFTPNGGAGSYVVTWTTSNATCISSATATITATAIPTAAGSVSGSNPKCSGSTSGLLTLTGNSNTITKWQSSTVYNFSSNVIDISNTASTYTSGALSATTYFRAVTSNGACSEYASSATIMVSASVPSPAGSISGITIQCSGLTGQVYSITDVNNASTYTWAVPTGWTITSGQGTSSITVTTGTAGQNGAISVIPSNICGASTGANLAVIVVSTVPATPGPISGTTTLCHNVSGQSYSVSAVANTTSYLWTVPTGWSITAGQGTTTLAVTSGASGTNGNIAVTAGNACGVSSASTLAVTVIAGSTAPTSITGNTSVCLGTGITLTASGGSGYTGCTYEWGTGSVGSNIISGATSNIYTVTPVVGNSTIIYWTRRLDASPCNVMPTEGVIKSVYVSVMPTFTVAATPNPAYTNASFSFTGAPSGMAYVWSNPSGYSSTFQSPIIYTPTATNHSGVFTVTVTNSYGCKSIGSTPYVTVSDVSEHTYISGNMNSASSWTNSATVNFAAAAQTYIINSDSTLNTNWTVSGVGSKIIVSGNTFTIPSNKTLTTTSPVVIDVKNGATLNIANSSIPKLGVLGLTSTVNFSGNNVNQIIPANYYGNLTIGNHGSGTVTFQSGYTGIYGTFSHDNANTYITTGNTIVFNGIDQNIPVFPYNNLSTEYGGNKTLLGDIYIKNHFRIGAVTTLISGTKSIYLEGTGELVSLAGRFDPGSGTVYYRNTSNATVKAMNYWNLNTVNGPRTLEPDSVISIANVFTPGTSTFTTTGSTVEFVASGTTLQTIPVLNPAYNNVKIFATTSTSLNLGGNVTIAGSLYMIKGKVTTLSPSFKLTVSNPIASAVSEGSSNSYIIGPMTRILNANSTPTNATFVFPVGDASYLPFSFSNYTTTTTQNITVQAISANCTGTYNSSLKSISTSEYWSASSNSLTDDFMCKVSLGKNSIGSTLKAIGHCHASSIGVFSSVNGSLSNTGNSVTGSTRTNFSFFVLAENTATQKTYYSKTGATNLSDLSNWTTNADGSGNTPITDGINFVSDNVAWIIQSSVTLANSLNITGSNANIKIQANVTIPSGINMNANNIELSSGNLTINSGATMTATGDFTTFPSTTILNSGVMNIVGNLSQEKYGSNSTITNIGVINLDGNYSLTGNNIFNNQGTFNMTTGSFNVANNSPANFTNDLNGKVLINNTNSSTSTISFPNSANLTLKATSSFSIIGSDVLLTATSPLLVDGLLTIQNGNMSFQGGGSGITVSNTGALYLFDTNGDPYSTKGIFDEGTGNEAITINGVFYVEGVTATGGTNSVNVGSAGIISIGNIGLVNTVGNNNAFKVNGGTINFCGNLSINDDKLGTITNGSTLNYTSSDYIAGVNPGTISTGGQGDFATDPGVVQIPAYSTKQACMDQFMADVVAAVPYSVTSSSNVLPISLDYFDVKLNGERVALEWRTETETNNDFFTVMKSYDASTFEILGTVNGAGTSTIKHNYKFYDDEPQNGLNYYKVKQTDFDGASTFTQTKSIKFKKKNVYMQVYPIPGRIQNITIKLWSEKSETINVMISDLLGRVYSSGQVEVSNDRLEIPLTSFAEFVPGKYIITVISNMFVENIEIIVE